MGSHHWGTVVLQKLACNQGQRCGRTEEKLCAERGFGKQVEVSAGREEGPVCLKVYFYKKCIFSGKAPAGSCKKVPAQISEGNYIRADRLCNVQWFTK